MQKNKPIREKEEIKNNPDNKIDQDFNGYPSGPAKDEVIHPTTKTEKKTADINNKNGKKELTSRNQIVPQMPLKINDTYAIFIG